MILGVVLVVLELVLVVLEVVLQLLLLQLLLLQLLLLQLLLQLGANLKQKQTVVGGGEGAPGPQEGGNNSPPSTKTKDMLT